MPVVPADVVWAARAELGTPWMHQGRLPGFALDCAGLVIVTARRLGLLPADFDINGYSRVPDGSMAGVCERYMQPIGEIELGAVLLLAVHQDPQHLAIVGNYRHGGHSIIHAASRAGRVIETRIMFAAGCQLRGIYRLPGVSA